MELLALVAIGAAFIGYLAGSYVQIQIENKEHRDDYKPRHLQSRGLLGLRYSTRSVHEPDEPGRRMAGQVRPLPDASAPRERPLRWFTARRSLAGAAALALVVLSACTAISGANPGTSAQPTNPRIIVVGDSVTEQAYGYAGGWVDAPSADIVKVAGSGWDLADAEPGYTQAVAQGTPNVTVLALGPNDADPATGGWDLADIYAWSDFMNNTVPDGSCLAVVLPRHKGGFPSSWATELDEARSYILDLGSPGGQFAAPTGVTVRMEDWRMRTAPNPDLLASDGIHLSGASAATVRQHMYWTGVNACNES